MLSAASRPITLVLLLTAFSWAQAPPRRKPPMRPNAPVIATEGIDISTERHHKLAFENEKVRVFAVELPAQAATGLLRHEYDFLMLALTDTRAEIAPERGRAQQVRMGVGELQLGAAGLVNRVTNKTSTPLRDLIIQILAGIEPKLAICGLGAVPASA